MNTVLLVLYNSKSSAFGKGHRKAYSHFKHLSLSIVQIFLSYYKINSNYMLINNIYLMSRLTFI